MTFNSKKPQQDEGGTVSANSSVGKESDRYDEGDHYDSASPAAPSPILKDGEATEPSSGSPFESDKNDLSSNHHRSTTTTTHQQHPQPAAARRYSISELVRTLGNDHEDGSSAAASSTPLPPELERRTRDFRLAQRQRRSKYGDTASRSAHGVYGLYQHLSSVRIDLEWAEDAAWRRQNGEPYLAWKDFDEARLKGLNRPWFTYAFVFICSIMLVVEFGVNDWKVEPLDVNPMIGPSAETLIKVGARDTELIVENGEWFRIFSPLILHAGIIHYLINMLALWFIGKAVELNHGMLNTIVLFMVPGVGANILSAVFLPEYISVGASGGIFGLIGACVADLGVNWRILFIRKGNETEKAVWRRNMVAFFILFVEIFINILIGLITPMIDNWAHLGGFIYGGCCAFSTIEALPVGFFGVVHSTWDKIRKIAIRFGGLIFTLILILTSTVWLATSDPGETPCPGCRYISCIPFPIFQEDKWWYCDKCDFVTAMLYQTGGFYDQIELTCPDETVVTIDISAEMIDNKQDVQRKLPTYCRDHCDSVL